MAQKVLMKLLNGLQSSLKTKSLLKLEYFIIADVETLKQIKRKSKIKHIGRLLLYMLAKLD